MANPFPLNERALTVTTQVNGLFGECGPAQGMWTFMFQPNPGFSGSLQVLARVGGQEAVNDGAPMVAVPYLALYLNGATVTPVTGNPGIWTTATITGTTLFQVPSYGLSPGILFACDAGTGRLYSVDALGGV